MNNVLKGSKRFFKKNSATILTCVGAAGVVATAISTAKATTKAYELLKQAEEFKGEELTNGEKFRLAAPIYIPSVLFGTATITAIFGANILNKRKQASLIGAYTMLDRSFKEYKQKTLELYGQEGHDHIVDEIVKENIDEAPKYGGPEKELFYDLYSGRYFENTMENVLKAENEINKIMHNGCVANLNELYVLLGLDPLDEYDELGWNSMAMEEMHWHAWIEFTHRKVVMDDGLECIIFEFPLGPIVDYLEY